MAYQPKLSDALDLIASLEAQCENLRRLEADPELLAELEALLAEIRDEISTSRRRD